MKMTFNDYDAKIEALKELPNVSLSKDYGITYEDLDMMKEDPEKYVPYLMYLSTRPWYNIENPENKEFDNEDAIPFDEAAQAIDELLYDLVELVDDEEDEK